MRIWKILWVVCALCVTSCSRSVRDDVLAHYEALGDTAALASAEFLLDNMDNKYTMSSSAMSDFYAFTDSLFKKNLPDGELRRQYKNFCQNRLELYTWKESDQSTLKAEFLIRHIDTMMTLYRRPWNSHLSSIEFHEYVLPYRIHHEEIELWMASYRNSFRNVISGLQADTLSLIDAAVRINQRLKRNGVRIVDAPRFCDGYKASYLLSMKVGQCLDYCTLGAFAMRSVGIPCAIDGYPDGHYWNVLILPGKSIEDFSACELNPGEQHVRRWLEYRHWKNVPRVYRTCFSEQAGSLALICEETPIPAYFRDPCLKDVTAWYYSGFTVRIPSPRMEPDRFGYLAVHDCAFQFVVWAVRMNGEYLFENLSDSIVYFPTRYREEHCVFPLDYPFVLLQVDGKTVRHRFVPDVAHPQRMTLYRKYHVKRNHNLFLKRALGAVVQGADTPDFSDARILCRVESVPEMRWTNLPVHTSDVCRYVRWLSPDSSYCSVAELQFYDREGRIVFGNVIGTDGYYDGEP
ncbi:MAG: transglutaminase domain-containing protein, partial [Paludibacteraceae bacterium]|nr:transglutaminase domain-containing protein [Paludibacteraceae bacterium]